jgi:hypothetical protein
MLGVYETKRYMVPRPYKYSLHELHILKTCFMVSLLFLFYFVGGLAHIFPTYFLMVRSQEYKKETKERSKRLPNNLYRIFPSMFYDS